MKILCIYHYGGKPDTLNTISFCCDKMQEEIITHHEIKVTTNGYILLGNRRSIKYCPYCGKLIIRNSIKAKNYDECEKKSISFIGTGNI